jgi:hypothetical protein
LQLADTRQDRHSYAHADVLSGAARAPDDDHERRTRLPAKELYTVTTACEPKAGVTKVHEGRMCLAWRHADSRTRVRCAHGVAEPRCQTSVAHAECASGRTTMMSTNGHDPQRVWVLTECTVS